MQFDSFISQNSGVRSSNLSQVKFFLLKFCIKSVCSAILSQIKQTLICKKKTQHQHKHFLTLFRTQDTSDIKFVNEKNTCQNQQPRFRQQRFHWLIEKLLRDDPANAGCCYIFFIETVEKQCFKSNLITQIEA